MKQGLHAVGLIAFTGFMMFLGVIRVLGWDPLRVNIKAI